jgi:hypothetical protein
MCEKYGWEGVGDGGNLYSECVTIFDGGLLLIVKIGGTWYWDWKEGGIADGGGARYARSDEVNQAGLGSTLDYEPWENHGYSLVTITLVCRLGYLGKSRNGKERMELKRGGTCILLTVWGLRFACFL